ncbi:MAG: M24 family metallopeptidase [Hyphomicrobiaceae bacterium]
MKGNFQAALEDARNHNEAPFPASEYRDRLSKVRRHMDQSGIDVLFAMAPESICYLSGFAGHWYQAQSGRAFPPTSGIAVHRDRDVTIHFETPSEAILAHIGTHSPDIRIFPLEARRDGLPFILSELGAAGWLKPGVRVGLELFNYRPNPMVARRYEEGFASQGLKVVDATQIIQGARHTKSPAEMACMEKAAEIAEVGMAAAEAAIAPGVTELEVFGVMVAAMTKAGGEFSGIIPPVISGFRSNALHPLATRRRIAKGERVNIDLCGVWNRYHVNMARGFWVGEPDKAALELHDRSIGVFPAVIEPMLKPDLDVVTFCEALKAYYVDQGIWDECYWSGGYEFGLAFPPDWVGSFIYDLSISKAGERFLPMTAVNHECNFFAPNRTGLSATIDTFLFGERQARIVTSRPRGIKVLHA